LLHASDGRPLHDPAVITRPSPLSQAALLEQLEQGLLVQTEEMLMNGPVVKLKNSVVLVRKRITSTARPPLRRS
jgi:hypothetical protein